MAKTDQAGALTWTGSYEAFGTRTRETGTNDDRQRANTKDEDPTGLLNEGHRYRDLETGTWLSRDPAGFVDGPNLYAYVRANPWSKFDPLGLAEEDPITVGSVTYANQGTKQIVDNVRKTDPRLDRMVRDLETSKYPHRIDARITQADVTGDSRGRSPRGQTFAGDPNDSKLGESAQANEDRINGKGTSSRIVAPKEPITTVEGLRKVTKTPEQTMTHELQHAWDISKGLSPERKDKPIGKGKPTFSQRFDDEESENRACRTENIYNAAKGNDLRTKYAGREVPNPGPENSPLSQGQSRPENKVEKPEDTDKPPPLP